MTDKKADSAVFDNHSGQPIKNNELEQERLRETQEKLETIVRWLDQSIPIPGTKIKIGLDPIIGLVPGVGDAIGLVMSGYVIFLSAQVGAPGALMGRMAGNVVLDALVGLVPVAGDIFDFAFKANTRNAKLLQTHLKTELTPPSRTKRRVKLLLAAALIAGLCGLLVLAIYGLISLLKG